MTADKTAEGGSAILRFSDYEVDTIAEHLQIIGDRGYVWWGWWKKRHEPLQSETLDEITARCPTWIGLANRGAEVYYRSKCEEVFTHAAEAAIAPTPEPEATPEYYRASNHIAWFKLSTIEEIDRAAFETEFGAIPQGEPTLFLVRKKGGKAQVVGNEVIDAPMFSRAAGETILHLSDLHFGSDHAYPDRLPLDTTDRKDLLGLIGNAVGSRKIGLVVVSGDFISRGDAAGYAPAFTFLESLAKKLKLEHSNIVLVPGNHDIWIRDEQFPARGHEHEQPFRMFLRGFYKDNRELEGLLQFETPNGWKISFVYLNSNQLRSEATKEYGYVGAHRYKPLLEVLAKANKHRTAPELAAAKVLNVAVLHHHILPGALVCHPETSRPVSLTLDAGQLVADLQEAGVHCVLHGHQHVPFVGSTARVAGQSEGWKWNPDPLYVLGMGSSGAKVERLADEMRHNTLGLYEPTAAGLRVQMMEFNASLTPRSIIDQTLPLSVSETVARQR